MCCYGGEQICGTSHLLLVERAKLQVALGGYEGDKEAIMTETSFRYNKYKQKVHTHPQRGTRSGLRGFGGNYLAKV
jgi:hypothetical protein